VIAEVVTASKQIWAVSRDHGFPFSNFLSKVGPVGSFPPGLRIPGQSEAPVPAQRGPCLIHMRRHHSPRQSRLVRCSQRYRLSHDIGALRIIHPLYWLHGLEAPQGRVPPSGTLVFGPRRIMGEHYSFGLSDPVLCLLLFPNNDTCCVNHDELERGHIWRRHHHCKRLLCAERKGPIYPACSACKAKSLNSFPSTEVSIHAQTEGLLQRFDRYLSLWFSNVNRYAKHKDRQRGVERSIFLRTDIATVPVTHADATCLCALRLGNLGNPLYQPHHILPQVVLFPSWVTDTGSDQRHWPCNGTG